MKPIAALLIIFASAALVAGEDRYPGGMPETPEAELPLLQTALEEGGWNERIHAVHKIGASGHSGLASLQFAAGDPDWQIRLTAVHWLGRLGAPAIPALADSLQSDPCRIIRISAIHWLGSIGPKALAALEETAEDESGVARISSWYWLRRLNPKKYAGKPPVSSPAEDLNVCVRSPNTFRTATASPEIETEAPPPAPTTTPAKKSSQAPKTMPEEEIARRALDRRAHPVPKEDRFKALEILLAGLPQPIPAPNDPTVSANAAREETSRSEAAILLDSTEPLGKPDKKLRSPKSSKRRSKNKVRAKARIASDHGSPPVHDALPDLLKTLKSGKLRRRARAADEIGALGEKAASAVPALMKALKDRSPRVRSSAAIALGKIGWASDPAVPRLIRSLHDKNPDVRYSASEALARIGTPAARKAFERYLRKEVRKSMKNYSQP